MQELSDDAGRRLKLKQEVQQKDVQIQQLQHQLQAAAQHAQRMQQQAQLQILRTYRAAAATSAEYLQDLKDRYFHTVPTGPRPDQESEHNLANVLRMQRQDIVAAYTEFQQRRGGIQSMPSMPATPSSHSSTARRNFLADLSQESLKQPWHQGSIQWPMPQEAPATVQEPSIAAAHGVYSFALRSINRSASTSPSKRGSPEQLSSPRQAHSHSHLSVSLPRRQDTLDPADSLLTSALPTTPAKAAVARQPHLGLLALPQAERSSSTVGDLMLGHAPDSAVMPSEALAMSVLPDVQPQPNWQLPFLQQLVQFEACLLTALMGLLTQGPKEGNANSASSSSPDDRQDSDLAAREQCWPRSAPASPSSIQDTTGAL